MKRIVSLVLCVLLMGCATQMNKMNDSALRHKWLGGNIDSFNNGWGNPNYTYTEPVGNETYYIYFTNSSDGTTVVIVETTTYGRITDWERIRFPDEK